MKVRKCLSTLLILLLLFSLTACGGNAATENDAYFSKEEMSPAQDSLSQENGSTTTTVLPQDRKLIRTVNIDAETEDLDAILTALTERLAALDGYVQDKNLRNGSAYSTYRYRSVSMTVRIPAENVDSFVEHVSESSNIVSSTENIEDVTLEYVDTESRVKALETEQERLIALLEKAETLKEILEIEDRLTDVRYELERYASQLRTLDNQVTYATVHLSITEVKEFTPVEEETTWERIAGGFTDSLKDIGNGVKEFVIWVLVNSPYLVIWGAIAAVVIVIIRKKRKPRAKKATPPEKTE